MARVRSSHPALQPETHEKFSGSRKNKRIIAADGEVSGICLHGAWRQQSEAADGSG